MTAAAVSLLVGLSGAGAASAASGIPAGVWIWDDGRAAVQFHPCGEALCGRIVWLKAEAAPQGRPMLDLKNPNPALRGRRVCGIDYITEVKPTKAGGWKAGHVYDFNGGANYDLDIDSVDGGQVRMRGYKGLRALGANLTLVRPTTDLRLCAASVGA
jgi:uncharacterized protein (DUF2147 family)